MSDKKKLLFLWVYRIVATIAFLYVLQMPNNLIVKKLLIGLPICLIIFLTTNKINTIKKRYHK
jgi:hypothetical protein